MPEPAPGDARVLLYAFHDAGRGVLAALLADGWPVVGLFTHRAAPDEGWFAPPEGLARAAGVPVFRDRSPNRPAAVARARALRPDVILTVMYRRLLGAPLLSLPARGAFNLHPSLLPRGRGRAPVNWAIADGEPETGVTLHELRPEADAGPIVAQARLPIAPDDTARTLHARLVPLFVALTRAWLPRIAAGTAPREPQDEARATTYPRRGPGDGAIDWTAPARRLDALVRAVTRPYPGAYARWEGQPLRVWAAAERPDLPGAEPGEARAQDGELRAQTGAGALALRDWEAADEGAAQRLRAAAAAGQARLGSGDPTAPPEG
jgi:methionyl-tRNA formyltransferase